MQILVGIVDMINGDLHPSDADVIPTYACNGLSVSVIYGQAWDVTSRLRAQTRWTEIKAAPSADERTALHLLKEQRAKSRLEHEHGLELEL